MANPPFPWDEQALMDAAVIEQDLRQAQAIDRAKKKYHLRLIRHAGWCYEVGSAAKWLSTGPVKDGQSNNRHARRMATPRARRGLV